MWDSYIYILQHFIGMFLLVINFVYAYACVLYSHATFAARGHVMSNSKKIGVSMKMNKILHMYFRHP